MVKFNENAIREAAYYNWQNAGCPQGKDDFFWAMAIEQLNSSCSSCTTKKVAKKSSSATSANKKKTASKK